MNASYLLTHYKSVKFAFIAHHWGGIFFKKRYRCRHSHIINAVFKKSSYCRSASLRGLRRGYMAGAMCIPRPLSPIHSGMYVYYFRIKIACFKKSSDKLANNPTGFNTPLQICHPDQYSHPESQEIMYGLDFSFEAWFITANN